MSSFVFEMKVKAIMMAIEDSLPELRESFGESISLDHVVDVIGPKKLLAEAQNEMIGNSVSSIRGEPQRQDPWIDIPALYSRAIEQSDSSYTGSND